MNEMKNSWDRGVDMGVAAAKLVNKTKVVLWNIVRAIVCLPFVCILFTELLAIGQQGISWPLVFWMVLSVWVIQRNIRKIIAASRSLVQPAMSQPVIQNIRQGARPTEGPYIDADFREIPTDEPRKKLENKPIKYKVIQGPNGEEIRLPLR